MRTNLKRKKKKVEKLNLIPILDAVFIFIFFLLMSAQFLEIYQVGSDLPIATDAPPPKDKDPLNLTLMISESKILIQTGLEGKTISEVSRKVSGEYDLADLHEQVYRLKKDNIEENSITLTPSKKIKYKEIVKIMDAVRLVNKDEEPFQYVNTKGEQKVERNLFNQMIFSNLSS